MKLTTKQKEELIVWEYFIPSNCDWLPKTDEDIQKFFEWSQQGKHKEDLYGDLSYFNALRQGKRWAGIHWEMYEEGVLEGTLPYFTILGGYDVSIKRKWWQLWKPKITFKHTPIPRAVVDQMRREMFKGTDAERIENCYQIILKESEE